MVMKLLGKKCGMTQIFDKDGSVVACTVIHAEPSVVTQIKNKNKDGYNAIQLGYEKIITNDPRTMEKRVSKPVLGSFKKQNIEPRRHLSEARLEDAESYQIGQEIGVSIFSDVSYLDVSSVSKGRGYQGTIKRYNFDGGPAAHGSGFHRHGGSTGMRSTPGRCFPGQKKPGQMGKERVTVQNLAVVEVDVEKQLIVVAGAIPGPKGGLVSMSSAKKKNKSSKKNNKSRK